MQIDTLRRLMISSRTVRRFMEEKEVSQETLRKLVELTRYCPSGRNAQPLKYLLVSDTGDREKVYPLLKWAGYFPDWDGPVPGQRPAAYLIQCLDTKYGQNCLCDDGLQLEALTLGARTLGLGTCIIKAFDHVRLAEIFGLDSRYEPRYVLAIGYPLEEVAIEDMSGDEDAEFKYYRTPDGVHHVPKRPLEELIFNISQEHGQ
ncbi:MAG: nitroreductase family protein [Muribaculaceae bacterium]|nr:nitroreductase family protein [Muribaculaceae bacterium]